MVKKFSGCFTPRPSFFCLTLRGHGHPDFPARTAPGKSTEGILIKELNPELNSKDEWANSNTLREEDPIRRDDLPNVFEEGIRRMKKSNYSH